jgi:hypothetical protein
MSHLMWRGMERSKSSSLASGSSSRAGSYSLLRDR